MAHAVTTTELYLVAMAIIFLVPYLAWRLARLDDVAPLVVVQIVAGVLLGPGVLGQAFPAAYQAVFTADVILALNGVAWWAVMLFVMLAGIELDLRDAWAKRRDTGTTAALALGVPLVLGAVVGLGMLRFDGWIGARGTPAQFVAGIGMACAVTALPILVLLMEKLSILRTPLGQRILRYASLDDLAIWGVLALVLMDWVRIGRQAAFLLAFAIACVGFRRLMRAIPERDRWYAMLVWLALCAFGADWSGLHFMVGAFLAGVVMDRDWFDHDALDRLRQHVLLLLMPVFFLSTGLRTGWEMGGAGVLLAAAALLVASVVGKLAGVRLAGRLLGWPPGDAALVGWLLQTKALIMIIFANVLLDKAIITSATFTALLLMAVASTVLTMPMAAPLLARRRDVQPAASTR
ncbi:MAG: cation:proton antiporter [Xanthomonadales bacterium]|nr:cation:proton antiporter [Xanthomonadales bacterium]